MSCGWDGTGPAPAACLFAQAFHSQPSAGDAGYCAQLCDCTSDCKNKTFDCVALAAAEVKILGRKGYCTIGDTTTNPPDVILSQCTGGLGAGGAGGAGGASSESAGAGGASAAGAGGAG
jgi:hypothetical protein